MIGQLLTIARNTFTESIRQPVFLVLLGIGILGLALNVALAAYTFDDDNKLLVDLGLSTIFLVGLLLAAFSATSVLSGELENRTVLTVVSKPVARPVFVLGKYLGVAGAIALGFYILSLVFAFTIRHRVMETAGDSLDGPVLLFAVGGAAIALGFATLTNYLHRWIFTSTLVAALALSQTLAAPLILLIDENWQFQSPLAEFRADEGLLGQVILGLVMLFQGLLVLAAVAIAASTRLGQIMTLLVCTGAFLLGLISNSFSQWVDNELAIPTGTHLFDSFSRILEADVALLSKAVFLLAKAGYMLLPNLQFFWAADAITEGHTLALSHILTLTLYTALYAAIVLAIAVTLFQTREVG